MTFGPDCARPLGHGSASSSNDAPRVGFARPADASDPELAVWVKDKLNPINFGNSTPCAFSGRVWRSSSQEAAPADEFSMICAVNALQNAWARYTTNDAALHGPWRLTDPSFATWHGKGKRNGSATGSISAPSFLPLPQLPRKSSNTTESSGDGGAFGGGNDTRRLPLPNAPTHMINALGGRGYWLGTYDAKQQKMSVAGEIQLVESLQSPANWFVAGLSERRDGRRGGGSSGERRVLHIGFITASAKPGGMDAGECYKWSPNATFCPLTCVRELSYDTAAKALVANPAVEYTTLRNGTLFEWASPVILNPGDARPLPLPASSGAEMDLEVRFALHATAPLSAGLDVLAAAQPTLTARATRGGGGGHGGRATSIAIDVSAARPDGSRAGNLTVVSGHRGVANGTIVRSGFVMLSGEGAVDVRVLVDRSIVEAFVAGGRGVATARDYPAEEEVGARVWSGSGGVAGVPTTIQHAAAWSMGCGWE